MKVIPVCNGLQYGLHKEVENIFGLIQASFSAVMLLLFIYCGILLYCTNIPLVIIKF